MVIKAAVVMIVYAVLVIGVGWLTFHVAPPGANAATALIVSVAIGAASIACAVMALMEKRDRRLSLLGIHLGLLIPVLGAIGAFSRFGPSLEKTETFNDRLELDGTLIIAKGGEQAVRPTAYQTVGLGASGALSVLAFVSLLVHRPTPAKGVYPEIVEPLPTAAPDTLSA